MRCFLLVVLSSHYTRCFFSYIHGTSSSLDLKRGQLRREVKMAATMDRLDVMARILKELSLGHLTELFHGEKITPDIISMLSTHEMNN